MQITCFRRKILDKEYIKIVKPLLMNDKVLSMKKYIQHGNTTTLEHCLNVSYTCYRFAKILKLDYKAAARAALLHDLYLYDWHEDIPEEIDKLGKHAFYHPKVALKNALQVDKLNFCERDMIMRHMWPVTVVLPKFKETWLIVFIDKYCAMYEFFLEKRIKLKKKHTR